MNGEKAETAVAVRSVTALPVANMMDIFEAGRQIAMSGMFGKLNDAGGFVVAATCHQEGITLVEFMRTYHPPIDGKLTMRADAMLAGFRQRGGRYRVIENSQTRAALEATFEGQTYTFEYTIEDGRRTRDALNNDGTLKHNWKNRPEDMLWARVASKMVRRLCPEVNAGMYPPEEVSDFDNDSSRPPMRVLTPEEVQTRISASKGATTAPAPAASAAMPDCTRVPDGFGDVSGKPWAELDDDMLAAAMESPDLDAGYKAAIRLVLDERKGGAL